MSLSRYELIRLGYSEQEINKYYEDRKKNVGFFNERRKRLNEQYKDKDWNKRVTKTNNKLRKYRKSVKPSEMERKIMTFLKRHNIGFRREVTFDWLKNYNGYHLFLDFYLPKYKIAIEYNGKQHYEGDARAKQNDATKFSLCVKHGIKFLTIPYFRQAKYQDEIINFFYKYFSHRMPYFTKKGGTI